MELWLRFVTSSLLVGAVIAALLASLPLWEQRFSATWRKKLWLTLFAMLLLPFYLLVPAHQAPVQIPLPAALAAPVEDKPSITPSSAADVATPQTQAPGATSASAVAPAESTPATAQAHSSTPTKPVSLLALLPLLWALGACLSLLVPLSLYFIWKQKVLRHNSPVKDTQLLDLYIKIAGGLKLSSTPPIFRNPLIDTPMALGLFRPTILLPDKKLPAENLRFVLAHELQHIAKKDLWVKWAMLAVRGVHWFNPMVWLLLRQAQRDIEFACDEAVVQGHSRSFRSAYCDTLLASALPPQLAQPSAAFTTQFNMDKEVIMKRFQHILDGSKKRKGVIVFFAVVSFSAVLASFVACTQHPLSNTSSLPSSVIPKSMGYIYPFSPEMPTIITAGYFEGKNTGLHISAPVGTPVLASADGEVVDTGLYDAAQDLGEFIVIDHGNGESTYYAFCQELKIKKGDAVTQGQQISVVAKTSRKSPELYYEQRKEGKPHIPLFPVPDLVGKTSIEAYYSAQQSGFILNGSLNETSKGTPGHPADMITEQKPTAGTVADANSGIKLRTAPYKNTYTPVDGFIRPVEKDKGKQIQFFEQGKIDGIMIAASRGTSVLASQSGTVVEANMNPFASPLGEFVRIDHGNGYSTLYARCHGIFVSLGNKVKQGDIIAGVNGTGTNDSSIALYFEIRKDGKAIEPIFVEEKAGGSAAPAAVFSYPLNPKIGAYVQNINDSYRISIHFEKDNLEILASQDGVIKELSSLEGGKTYSVLLEHENGYSTFYTPCKNLLVKTGDHVKKDQPIAIASPPWESKTPLYYEQRYNNKPIQVLFPAPDVRGMTVEESFQYINGSGFMYGKTKPYIQKIMDKDIVLEQNLIPGQLYPAFTELIPTKIKEDPEAAKEIERLAAGFIRPCEAPISRGFEEEIHTGIDFLTPNLGSQVGATHKGTVKEINNDSDVGDLGKYIVIEHPNGYSSYYAALQFIFVKPGDEVVQGDMIAISGGKGKKIVGAHLHFELRKDGKPIPPVFVN